MQVSTEVMPISCGPLFKRVKEVGFICCSDSNTKIFVLKKSKLEDREIGHNHGSYV